MISCERDVRRSSAAFIGSLSHSGTLDPGQSITLQGDFMLPPAEGAYDVGRWTAEIVVNSGESTRWQLRGERKLVRVTRLQSRAV